MIEKEDRHKTDTLVHIFTVREYLDIIADELGERGFNHDQSKLEEPEFSGYMGLSEAVKGLAYGSMAYRAAFAPYKEVIQHHYQHNDHHIEHFDGDISKMNLMQITELLCDWKAASTRNSPTLLDTLEATVTRFQIEEPLAQILRNTVVALGW